MPYAPLGIRTEFSFSRSMCRVDGLVERAQSLEIPAVGIADLHATWAWPGFAEAARSAGIRPILGARVSVDIPGLPAAGRSILTLLAMNDAGVRNIVWIIGQALENKRTAQTPPAVTLAALDSRTAGIVVLDGGEEGPVGVALRQGRNTEAQCAAAMLKDVFGSAQVFIEIRRGGADPRRLLEPGTLRIARSLNIPVVATADVRYLDAHDRRAYEVLRRLPSPENTLAAIDASTTHAHLRSPAEMQRLFADLPEALEATLLVAERCSLDVEQAIAPLAETAQDHADDADHVELARRCTRAACEQFGASAFENVPATARARIAEELGAIGEANLASGFLLAHDAARHAVRERIPLGAGPGVVAGSFVAYLLGLSESDPMQHGIHFRAGLTCARGVPREMQLEVGHRGHSEIVRFVRTSSRCQTVQVATMARRSGVALLREVGRALAISDADVESAAAHMLGREATRAALELSPGLQRRSRPAEAFRELVEVCSRLEGLPYHAFPRAGSLLVLPRMETDRVVQEPTADGRMAQLTERDAEALGWLRFDLIAARHRTMLADASAWVSRRRKTVSVDDVSHDDEPTFRKLAHSDTSGIVHLESALAQRLLQRVQPARLGDLADVLALCAQAQVGFDQSDFLVARRSGRVPSPRHIAPPLVRTHGLILYREQIFELARDVAGMDPEAAQAWLHALARADRMRQGNVQRRFVVGALESGLTLAQADALFEQILRARQSASRLNCLSMALGAYRSAYFLVHHPREFVFALLRNSEGQEGRQARVRGMVAPQADGGDAEGAVQRGGRGASRQLQLTFGPEERDRRVRQRRPATAAGGRQRVWLAGQIGRRA